MPDKNAKPTLSQEQLRKIAEFVLRESATSEVRSVVTIGWHVYVQLFRSSEEAFRSKGSTKPDSLNDLAAQPGMAEAGWSRSRLRNAIEVSLMAKRHGNFKKWPHLTVSHLEEVIGLPGDKQSELLGQAEKGGWSVARLRAEAAKLKPPRPVPAPGSKTPDTALGRVRKAMGQVAPLSAAREALATSLVESGIDARAAAEFTATVEKALGMLQRFQKQLEEMKKQSAARLKRVAGKIAG